ncbi:MAG: flagellar basal body P-ring formation protein FlgA [Planctomycetota bacterium]|nr:flagellar basal body P-ring formation protein FlgA [Planctomycetota bacterium]
MTFRATLLILCLAPLALRAAEREGVPTAADEPAAAKVTLRKQAASQGEEIKLGEIADVQGPAGQTKQLEGLVVARAAAPGKSRRVSLEEVRKTVREGLPGGEKVDVEGDRTLEVKAAAQRVEGSALADAAAQGIRDRLHGQYDAEVTVEIAGHPDFVHVRPGNYELTPELPAQGLLPGFRTVRVRAVCDGRWCADGFVSVRIHVLRNTPVAARRVEAGETLGKDDLSMELRECGSADLAKSSDPADFIGKRAKVTIPAGRMLEERLIERVPDVLKGDRVEVTVTRGSLSIRTVAMADGDAARGDTLRVKLLDSNEVLIVKVTGKGRAEL